MKPNVVTPLNRRNGNVGPAVATDAPALVALDVDDAAYHTAHAYPGGVPALALRMGMSANSLFHKVSVHDGTHHLGPAEMRDMMHVTQDARMLHALAWPLGYVCIATQAGTGATTLSQVMQMAKEFGEVLAAVNDAVADGRVTPNEMQECERQAAELIGALNSTLAAVRGMMPAAPAGVC
jgi:hypothetical protein